MSAFCRCVDWPKKRMVWPFFFDSPAPNPLQTTFCCSLSATFLTLVGYCSAEPLQLGADSDRAPCPAPQYPVPCSTRGYCAVPRFIHSTRSTLQYPWAVPTVPGLPQYPRVLCSTHQGNHIGTRAELPHSSHSLRQSLPNNNPNLP